MDPTFKSPHRHLLSPPTSPHLPNDTSGSPGITQHLCSQVNAGGTNPWRLVSHASRELPRGQCIAGGSLLLREGPRGGQGSSTHLAATSGRGHAAEEGEADSKGANCTLNVRILGQPGSPAQAAGAHRRGAWAHHLVEATLPLLERRGHSPPCVGPCDVLCRPLDAHPECLMPSAGSS